MGGPRQNSTDIKTPPPPPGMHIREYFRVCLRNYGPFTDIWVYPLKKTSVGAHACMNPLTYACNYN